MGSTQGKRSVKCVAADPAGGVSVGTRDDGMLLWKDGVVRQINRSEGLASPYVRSLLTTPAGDVWIGTDMSHAALQRLRGGVIQDFALPRGSGAVCAMAVDAAGVFWAGTTGGSLMRVEDDKLVNETLNTLVPARGISGREWGFVVPHAFRPGVSEHGFGP